MSERLNQQIEFDVLRDILETLRFRGSIFFQSDLASPWGMSLEKTAVPRFHVVMSGECFVGTPGHEAIRARQTDIVMLPNGSSHWIADQPGRKLVPSARAGAACELGNPLFQKGRITNRLVCGMVQFDQGATHPILANLPEVMHFPKPESAGPIWSIVTAIEAELRSQQGRSKLIADRLTEVLFLQLLRHYVSSNENATGFLAALRDQRIYRALTLIHRDPAANWSLASLGEQVGMSRATLVRHFKEIVGVAPMAYITDWRIMKAFEQVKNSGASLARIADSVGFASAQTLSKTFKKQYGCTPNELRQKQ